MCQHAFQSKLAAWRRTQGPQDVPPRTHSALTCTSSNHFGMASLHCQPCFCWTLNILVSQLPSVVLHLNLQHWGFSMPCMLYMGQFSWPSYLVDGPTSAQDWLWTRGIFLPIFYGLSFPLCTFWVVQAHKERNAQALCQQAVRPP